ncbi:MAG: hypothetical protein HQK50_00850 [Oligoflexia bacterium]|nr:hypothetical protein [Oligoflexia bacterium]MBF0364084.1 hypothetical protein [Oligoflexia bacterium]
MAVTFANDVDGANLIRIVAPEQGLQLYYGVYAENILSAERVSGRDSYSVENIVLYANDSDLPPGLILKQGSQNSATLEGIPLFVDEWCFTLFARANDGARGEEWLCAYVDPITTTTRLRFAPNTSRYLSNAIINEAYYKIIDIEVDYDSSNLRFLPSTFPSWLTLGTQRNSIQLSGTPEEIGENIFSIGLYDKTSGDKLYRQFQVTVLAPINEGSDRDGDGDGDGDDSDGRILCPPGYYFSDNLQYCVEDRETPCPSGSYYDPNSGACIEYPQAPTFISCGPYAYYDSFLMRCTSVNYERCPFNYRWNPFYNRCVRLPRFCSYGYEYSSYQRRCIPIFSGGMNPFPRPDYHRPDHRPGNYHRPSGTGFCHRGMIFDPQLRRCVAPHHPAWSIRPPRPHAPGRPGYNPGHPDRPRPPVVVQPQPQPQPPVVHHPGRPGHNPGHPDRPRPPVVRPQPQPQPPVIHHPGRPGHNPGGHPDRPRPPVVRPQPQPQPPVIHHPGRPGHNPGHPDRPRPSNPRPPRPGR